MPAAQKYSCNQRFVRRVVPRRAPTACIMHSNARLLASTDSTPYDSITPYGQIASTCELAPVLTFATCYLEPAWADNAHHTRAIAMLSVSYPVQDSQGTSCAPSNSFKLAFFTFCCPSQLLLDHSFPASPRVKIPLWHNDIASCYNCKRQ